MEEEKTLKENLEFLIQQSKREIAVEETRTSPNYMAIEIYASFIDALEFAIEISKKGD